MCEKCVAISWQAWVCLPFLLVMVKTGGTKMKEMLKRIATAIRFRKTIVNPWKYAYGKPARKDVKHG